MKTYRTPMILTIILVMLAACTQLPAAAPTAVPTTPATAVPTSTTVPAPTETPAIAPIVSGSLSGVSWQWVSFTNPVEQYSIDNPQDYTLTFNEDGTVSIQADCNNATGIYSVDGSSIKIEIGPMTMAACPPESHSDDFVKYLGFAAIYFFEDGNLFIDLFADGGTLEFAPAPVTATAETGSLTANAWQWISFTNPIEQYEVEHPEKFQLIFSEDGTLVILADCNTVLGTYTTDGQSIKIELGPATLVACPEGSRSDQFLSYLPNAAIYSFQDGDLLIDLFADGGTLMFSPYDPLAALKASNWQQVLEKSVQSCDALGAVLLADTPRGRFLSAYGVASTQEQTPVKTSDKFQIGSNTKSFTTVLALLLQEDGVWSLDDPLSKWLPEQAAKIQNGDQITLRMLGQNHTGLPDYADFVIGDALNSDNLDEASLEKGYSPEELVDIGLQLREPNFAPGEGWEYSTTNFILLAMAIEAATGESLDQLYQEHIFDTLEMNNTYLLNNVPEEGSFVNGYYTLPNGEAVDVTNWNGSQGWAGGSIVSTAEDMAKYMQSLASGSIFSDPDSLSQLTDFGDGAVASFPGYGLGVGIWSQDPFGWGHAGQTPGFQSLWVTYPDKHTNVVLLTNSGTCSVQGLIGVIQASPELFEAEIPE